MSASRRQYKINNSSEDEHQICSTKNTNKNSGTLYTRPLTNPKEVYDITNILVQCFIDCGFPRNKVYGVALSGDMEIGLPIPSRKEQRLVFLFKVSQRRQINKECIESVKRDQEDIAMWIKKKYLDKQFRISIKSGVKLFFKNFVLAIETAFTYEKRQYHMFHYKEKYCHLYPLSKEDLGMVANDLNHESRRYLDDIAIAEKEFPHCRNFLEKNMKLSLALLESYYIQESIHKDSELLKCIGFLRCWQEYFANATYNQNITMGNDLELLAIYAHSCLSPVDVKFATIVQRVLEIVLEMQQGPSGEALFASTWQSQPQHDPKKKNCTWSVVQSRLLCIALPNQTFALNHIISFHRFVAFCFICFVLFCFVF
ncbi:hypothetical protein RFI_00682 [Reticulomyxa filosa]|uniref:Uncharacterized protein n=1 Tax=Reticulomyxa filosa TaxID=46433 RepID=X6PDX3_RETFI|nr:hypothetical protein RFI_00682 [Reticulomyxa filosa]|eukprot:ETO36381.1 hypothetical protein RFI_00682 [Reticulomyxa filosa]